MQNLGSTKLKREFFIDNLLVRILFILFIVVMIRWTGLALWEFEFPFPGSFTSTFLATKLEMLTKAPRFLQAHGQDGRMRLESGPLKAVYLSLHKWLGGYVN